MVGTTDGSILVASTETFEFVDSLTMPFPAKHRGKLDLRSNVLNKLKASRMNKKQKKRKESPGKARDVLQKQNQIRKEKKKEKLVKEGQGKEALMTPVIWLGVTGPQLVKGGQRAKVVAEYADGTVCLHCPMFEGGVVAEKGEAGGIDEVRGREERSDDRILLQLNN